MNNSGLGHKIYSYLLATYKWYLRTPERSLDEAYNAALEIQKLENEYFNGNKIGSDLTPHSSSVMDYFESNLKKQLRIIRMRLTEFRASRFFVNESNQKSIKKLGIEHLNPSIVLEKLRFIDEVTAKYTISDEDIITREPIDKAPDPQIEALAVEPKQSNIIKRNLNNNGRRIQSKGKTDTTGVLPRSIFNTINRLQIELDPKSEQDVVQNFRKAQRRTIISVRFLLLLIIVPILTHQLSKAFIVGPIVNHFKSSEEAAIFLNYEMEEQALLELQRFEEKIKFQNLISSNITPSEKNIEIQVREKALEIAEEYRLISANAIKNVFADILSVIAFIWFLLLSKKEIAVLKDFLDHVVYGLSDSAKAFIIILFTDIFVGFHSPHGWEVILEGISRHWGLPANHDFIFLFIATFPVILDTIFKYWIFRYLNRISPSAVATYRNMNE
ncbi:MAG: proton extrusion protein PcxA [Chlorogloeopsis fritschii C42_A2020_084]|uniref:proton extrusion protein PcxA n=1 Tax=Chlorogloeopsis fritschii TaxID=1124 RepID=UPI0019E145DC|nr:proton extrusion protein PcxA [Chlorogloeopsis fritschii]MBF2006694.1 proton extrusion protein PcxA [Chlorogloeopsis fritschii C42_A2020_084]